MAQLGEPPKRRRWRIQRGGEVKKQGESRSASSERGDYVSEGRAAHIAVEKRISFYATVAQLGEPPKRRRWRIQRGGEVKKQGAMRRYEEQCDYVSEGRAAHTAVEKRISLYATVAQLVEQRIRNAQAVGSSPTSSSNKSSVR